MPSPPAPLSALADERYVSLTTFRRSGDPVSTPVWVAGDGEGLVVLTPDGTGKVKRLGNDDRVELRPCSRTGRVADGTAPTPARAVVERDRGIVTSATTRLRAKYGLEYRLFMLVERLVRRGDSRTRVVVRIAPDEEQ